MRYICLMCEKIVRYSTYDGMEDSYDVSTLCDKCSEEIRKKQDAEKGKS